MSRSRAWTSPISSQANPALTIVDMQSSASLGPIVPLLRVQEPAPRPIGEWGNIRARGALKRLTRGSVRIGSCAHVMDDVARSPGLTLFAKVTSRRRHVPAGARFAHSRPHGHTQRPITVARRWIPDEGLNQRARAQSQLWAFF